MFFRFVAMIFIFGLAKKYAFYAEIEKCLARGRPKKVSQRHIRLKVPLCLKSRMIFAPPKILGLL